MTNLEKEMATTTASHYQDILMGIMEAVCCKRLG
jgi:hypothetical protein